MNKISKQQQQEQKPQVISFHKWALHYLWKSKRSETECSCGMMSLYVHTDESEITDELFRDAGGANRSSYLRAAAAVVSTAQKPAQSGRQNVTFQSRYIPRSQFSGFRKWMLLRGKSNRFDFTGI